MFVTSYSGNLVAFMTFPKIENPVSSIDDVLQYRGVASWGFMSGSVIEDHLKVCAKFTIYLVLVSNSNIFSIYEY